VVGEAGVARYRVGSQGAVWGGGAVRAAWVDVEQRWAASYAIQRLTPGLPGTPSPATSSKLPLKAHLVLLKVVAHYCEAPRAQQVLVHQLLAGRKVGAQPDAQQCQIAADGAVVACRRGWSGNQCGDVEWESVGWVCWLGPRRMGQARRPSCLEQRQPPTSFQVARLRNISNHRQACR
jgi:hypothetical protein